MPYKNPEVRRAAARKRRAENIEAHRARQNEYRRKNADAINAKQRKWRADNLEHARQWSKEYRDSHPGEHAARVMKAYYEQRKTNPQAIRDRKAKFREMIRQKVLDFFGSTCVRCGCSEAIILQVDHINGDGAVERKKTSNWNWLEYLKRIKADPETTRRTLQLLCPNCHWIKREENGECLRYSPDEPDPGYREWNRNYMRERRATVLSFFGGKCVQCGFSDSRALQIDHVNGDGAAEIRMAQKKRAQIIWQAMNTDPEAARQRYQCLCATCNWRKFKVNREFFKQQSAA